MMVMASQVFKVDRTASLLLTLLITAFMITTSSGGSELSDLHEVAIQSHLKRINKPPVKTIKSPDGDIIDCVEITDQPAFDHPLLKNHTIQMRPSFFPKDLSSNTDKQPEAVTQLWQKNGKCPENTIPIKRTTREDLLRWGSIENYGKKDPKSIRKHGSHKAADYREDDEFGHEYAIMRGSEGKYHGGQATFSLWKPYVQNRDEYSVSQMWIVGGSDDSDINTLEAGWQVYPKLYGDYKPRFSLFWTADGYQKTGCYNLKCPGFVQTNASVVIGGTFDHYSTYGGTQYTITILIRKDPASGNWWLVLNDVSIGYWPASIFKHLKDYAWHVEWGGEILNFKEDGKHTTTGMGSGHFAEEGFKKSCYIKQILLLDENNVKKELEKADFVADNERCYNIKQGRHDPQFGTYIYFGGPGRNPNCP